jgi:hypothetical protein
MVFGARLGSSSSKVQFAMSWAEQGALWLDHVREERVGNKATQVSWCSVTPPCSSIQLCFLFVL